MKNQPYIPKRNWRKWLIVSAAIAAVLVLAYFYFFVWFEPTGVDAKIHDLTEELKGYPADYFEETMEKCGLESLLKKKPTPREKIAIKMDLVRIGKPAVPRLIELLKYNDPNVRASVADALGRIRDTRAVEPLIAALEDKDFGVRMNTAWALGRLGDTRAVEPLFVLLKDERDGVRETTAEALGRLGDTRAVKHLIPLLKKTGLVMPADVIWALGELGDRQAAIAIIESFDKFKRGLNEGEFSNALQRIGSPSVEPLVNALDARKKEFFIYAIDTLGEIGDSRATMPLLELLKDEKTECRYNIFNSIANIGDDRAVQPLIDIVNSPKARKNDDASFAAEALGNLGSPKAVQPLIDILSKKHKDNYEYQQRMKLEDLHAEAATALGKLKDPRAVIPLINALKGGGRTCARTVDALGSMGDERAVKHLIEMLSCVHCGVTQRDMAADALGEIGDVRAVETLISVLDDEEVNVPAYAIRALVKIGDPRAIEPLITALNNEKRDVQEEAMKALGKFGDRRAVEPLIAMLNDDEIYRQFGTHITLIETLGELGDSRAINHLREVPKRKKEEIYHTQIPVLGALLKLGQKDAFDSLLEILKCRGWRVQSDVFDVLGNAGDKRAVPILLKELENNKYFDRMNDEDKIIISALGKIGDERAVEPLVRALNTIDSGIRWRVIEALTKIGGAKTITSLEKLIASEKKRPYVRKSAREAIKSIRNSER